jgi:hypothetical protein
MKGAVLPPVVEVTAGRDHLSLDRILGLTGDLAKIGRLPGAEEALEAGVAPWAKHLNL